MIIVEEELPTLHSSEVTRRVVLVEEELPTLQKYTTGATSGCGTTHSSEVAQLVLLVEKKLPTFQKKHDWCF